MLLFEVLTATASFRRWVLVSMLTWKQVIIDTWND